MAMAECPVNEELHPFFRPRLKEDTNPVTQVAKEKSHEEDSQPPKPPAKIPAMFLQQQPTKSNPSNDNQHKKQHTNQRQSSPSSPLWPDSDYYYGGDAEQTYSQDNDAYKVNIADSGCDYSRNIPFVPRLHRRRAKAIAEDVAHSYFKLQKDKRETDLKSEDQPPRQPMDLHIPLLTRSHMTQLLDTMYPNGWRKSSFVSLFDYLYPVSTDVDGLPTQDPRFIPWRDKYRPLTIDGLVGNPENCTYLRDWLQEMKVSPIAAPLSKNPKVGDKLKLEPTKTKRKLNIPDDLQDFIVDSDEELGGFSFLELLNAPMFDFDDNDDDFQPDVIHSRKPRKHDSKNTKKMEGRATSNLILLVGDHGTGKTAAVYTAASEVGYDVFEINAGQKRNAKEILAIVGEMAESHQVSFENVDRETFDPFASFAKQMEVQAATSTTSDQSKAAKSDQPAPDTGKRKRGRPRKNDSTTKVKKSKSMGKAPSGSGDITRHFLRMNVKSVSPPPDSTILVVDKQEDDPSMIDIETIVDTPDIDSNTVHTAVPTNTPFLKEDAITTTENQSSQSVTTSSQCVSSSQFPSQDMASSEARSPRQSLILLEEVDILYDEDKTFWSAVINLAQKSKRPIVMTCNDIRMVPYEILALQATLQFDLPDIEETTQYLQLVCLAEGHLIDPSELYYLCIIFGQDLRKLLNSLELWSRKQLSNNDRTSVYVHRCLIEKIIGSDETFNSHVTTIMQQRQEMYITESDEVNADMDDFTAKIDTISFVDGFCRSERANQINEIDEYGPSKDNTLGHKFIWKVPSDYDHWDIDDRIVKAACSLNEKVLPDLGTAIGRNGTMATLGNHNVQSCISTLVSFRTKVQCEEQVATEYLPFVVSMCKSDNAMLMAQALPAPGQLRSMRRRGVRRHLSQITQEQSCQIENDLQSAKPVLASSIGKELHMRFEEALRSKLTTE